MHSVFQHLSIVLILSRIYCLMILSSRLVETFRMKAQSLLNDDINYFPTRS